MKTERMEAWNDGRKENLYSERIYRIFRIIVFEMQRLNILLIVPAVEFLPRLSNQSGDPGNGALWNVYPVEFPRNAGLFNWG